jgi:hypothetical protein
MKGIPERDNEFIQNAISHVVQYFQEEFGCIVTVSNEYPSNRNVISLDITLPPNKEIFAPTAKELRVFRIDTAKQIMTVMYYPSQN